jgi:16S rRNA processing protein RimM
MTRKLVPIAEIARPHGVLGELRLKLYNEDTDLIGKGRRVHLIAAAPAPGAKERAEKAPKKKKPTGVKTPEVTPVPLPQAPPAKVSPAKAQEPVDKTIVSVRPTSGALLIRLSGVDDRDQAEALQGMQICVERRELPELPEGEFYASDVEGARVELVSGDLVGTVTEFRTYPTCSVLVVSRTAGGAVLEVPLVEDYVAEVDTRAGLVKLHHIDEL